MDNQHQQIKGYRELSQEEIDLMNEIKQKAEECGNLVEKLRSKKPTEGLATADGIDPLALDQRWVSIGATDLQTGFMALVRSVAKPESF